ncbi:MAG: hypothetical protein ACKVOW_00550 [Chitinophagaceae bacterium]
MKKIISIMLYSLCTISVSAQLTDTSYHLLWYKGKKIRENVVRTTKGEIVNYNPSNRTLTVSSQSGEGKQMDGMLTEISKTTQRITEISIRLMKHLPKDALPVVLYNVSAACNQVNEEYRSALSAEINIPDFELPEKNLSTHGRGPSAEIYEITVDPIDKIIEEMQHYMNVHKEDKFTALLLPVPPTFDYTYCYSCNT